MNTASQTLCGAIQAVQDYVGLLDRIGETTDQLMTAIESWDSDKVSALIEDRSQLFDRIGQTMQLLAGLQPKTISGAPEEARALEVLVERAREKERLLLGQQTQAEQSLTAEIDKRRPAVAHANQRRAAHRARPGRPAEAHGRFLDSRI